MRAKEVVFALLASHIAKTSIAFQSDILLRKHQTPFRSNVLHVGLDSNSRTKESANADNDDAIRKAYDEWRSKHDKGKFDAMRFENFKANYRTLEEKNAVAKLEAREQGKAEPELLSLDKFGDCSAAERNAMQTAPVRTIEKTRKKPDLQAIDLSEHFEKELEDLKSFLSGKDNQETDDSNRIQHAYKEWCKWYGKEYDEARLKVFAANFRDVEEYFRKTGRSVQLNKHADLTVEEFNTMQSALPGTPPNGAHGLQRQGPDDGTHGAKGQLTEEKRDPDMKDQKPDVKELGPEGDERLTVEEIKQKADEGAKLIHEEQERIKNARAKRAAWEERVLNSQSAKSNGAEEPEVEIENKPEEKIEKENEIPTAVQRTLTLHIREAYKQYCKFYGKEFNEERLPLFQKKLLKMKEQSNGTVSSVELDENFDLTPYELDQIKKEKSKVNGKEEEKPTQGAGINVASSKNLTEQVDSKKELASVEDGEDRIRAAYKEWCREHGKEFDENRLDNFADNFRKVEKYQQKTGKVLKLNVYSDLTKEEYNKAMAGGSAVSPRPSDTDQPSSSPSQIRAVYNEWCQHYGKEPSEWRFPNFQSNYLRVERHFKATGEALDLNEDSDLFPDELAFSTMEKDASEGKKEVETVKSEAESKIEELQAKLKDAEEESRLKAEEIQNEAKRIAQEKADLRVEEAKMKAEENARRKAQKALLDARKEAEEEERRRARETENQRAEEEAVRLENIGIIKRARAEVEEVKKAQKLLSQERKALEEAKKRVHQEVEKIEMEVARARSRRVQEQVSASKMIDFWEIDESTPLLDSVQGDWIEKVLSVFGAKEAEKERPGRGTISLQSKTMSSPFNFFVTSDKTETDSSSDRPQATFVEKKPSILSFFAPRAKEDSLPSPTRDIINKAQHFPFLSPFGSFLGNADGKKNEDSGGRPQLDDEKKRAIRTKKERERRQRASRLAAERALALEKASAKEAARVKRQIKENQGPSIWNWFGDGDGETVRSTMDLNPQHYRPQGRSSQRLKAGVPPTLSAWHQNSDGSITGVISNSFEYKSGTKITTSPIQGKAKDRSTVTTVSGSKYRLEKRKGKK